MLVLGLTGCSSPVSTEKAVESVAENVEEQIKSVIQKQEEHVLLVQSGYPLAYPTCTYGATFDEFFGTPTWTCFKADSGEDVVEFTGYCLYQEVEVKACLQFILDVENNTFEAGAMSFNDVPQSSLITLSLIDKAFTEYMDSHPTSDDSSKKLIQAPEEETTAEATNEYILYESNTRAITDAEVSALTSDQLRIALNEIYARHGRRFKDAELQAWFDSKSWYNGTVAPQNFSDSVLSQIEKDNVVKLSAARDKQQGSGFTAGWIYGEYENHDGFDAAADIGWESGDGIEFIALQGNTKDGGGGGEFYGLIISSSNSHYIAQDEYGNVLSFQYNGTDRIEVFDYNSNYGMGFPGFSGIYMKTKDLPQDVS